MTPEQKAQAYDKALEKAKQLLRTSVAYDRFTIEKIFPELRESEDEKIRNEIILYIGAKNDISLDTHNKWLSWLEKQAEQKPIIEMKSPEESLGISSKEYNEIVNGCIYGESKPADNLESKFHEGDWIVSIEYGNVARVLEVLEDNYRLNYGVDTRYLHGGDTIGALCIELVDSDYRLWDITKDAKDGDVLVGSKGDVILMFRKIGNTEWDDVIDYHCYYDCYREDFIVQEDVEYWGNTENSQLKPATKEQRELLFQKMKESGYTFDLEKKELKKIEEKPIEIEGIEHVEHGKYYYCIKDYYSGGCKRASKGEVVQALRGMSMMALGVKANEYFIPVKCIVDVRPSWSHEDDVMVRDILCWLPSKSRPEFNQRRADWLKSLKNRVQPKYEWSEEDEQRINRIADFIWKNRKGDTDEVYQQEQDVKWLNSLKEKYNWKPSYEQLETLWCAAENYLESDDTNVVELRGKVLESLYHELKNK